MIEDSETEGVGKPKIANRTEQFYKAKTALLWYSSALILVSLSKENESSTVIGIHVNTSILAFLLFFATFYHLLNFLLDWNRQYDLNRELTSKMLSGDILSIHNSISHEMQFIHKSLLDYKAKFEDFSENSNLKFNALYSLNQSIENIRSIFSADGLNNIDSNFSDITMYFDDAKNLRADFMSGIKDEESEITINGESLQSFHRFLDIFENVQSSIHAIPTLIRKNYERAESITSSIPTEEFVSNSIKSQVQNVFGQIESNFDGCDKSFSKLNGFLSRFGKFEARIAKSDRIRLLVMDGAIPLCVAFTSFSAAVYYKTNLLQALKALF